MVHGGDDDADVICCSSIQERKHLHHTKIQCMTLLQLGRECGNNVLSSWMGARALAFFDIHSDAAIDALRHTLPDTRRLSKRTMHVSAAFRPRASISFLSIAQHIGLDIVVARSRCVSVCLTLNLVLA